MKPVCVNCNQTKPIEELAVDEYNEVWCQDCIDSLPEDELEDSEWRAYTSVRDDDETSDS